jgi:hypothetical protein
MNATTRSTLFALSALVTSMSATASAAPVAAGTWDGDYALRYGSMTMAVQCGYASSSGAIDGDTAQYTIDLAAGGTLADDAFEPFVQSRYAAIEAADLRPGQEKAAMAATDAFFAGLEASLEAMIATYPDELRIDAVDQASPARRSMPSRE